MGRPLCSVAISGPDTVALWGPSLPLGDFWALANQYCNPGKMPGDAKLETADELVELYNNPENLKAYKYTQPIVSTKGINNEKFHMELPYQEIKSIVEKCGEDLFAAIPPEERAGLRWEHVGSTSIEGMPGAMMPDALLILPSFPPSKAVVQVSIWNSEASLPLCSFLGSPGLWLLLQQLQPPGPSRP